VELICCGTAEAPATPPLRLAKADLRRLSKIRRLLMSFRRRYSGITWSCITSSSPAIFSTAFSISAVSASTGMAGWITGVGSGSRSGARLPFTTSSIMSSIDIAVEFFARPTIRSTCTLESLPSMNGLAISRCLT